MRIAEYALPVAALAALAACNGDAVEEDGDEAAAASPAVEEDATQDVAEAESTPATLDNIPANFRGYWDSTDDSRLLCTDVSDGMMYVAKKEIGFYEANFEPETITQVSPDEITSKGVYNELGESSDENYSLKLSKDGKRLTLDGGGFNPFEYRKCGAELKKANLDAIPAEFHGKWAFSQVENCKIKPFRDLIITDREVTIGGIKGTVETMDVLDTGSIKVGYKTTDGRDASMRLGLTPDGQKVGLLEPGATGVTFVKCP